jgi:hypothetical protein
MENNTAAQVTVKAKIRPSGLEPFGELWLNGCMIWRFDNVNAAELAAVNLRKALAA